MKTVYISNHPRETSTNQILNAREHGKMEVDNKSSFLPRNMPVMKKIVCLIIISIQCIANAVQVVRYIK